jgi:hypothetical protein
VSPGVAPTWLSGLTALFLLAATSALSAGSGAALVPGANPAGPVPIPGGLVPAPGAAPPAAAAPAPLPPPVNPGYAPAAPSGLSPILTEPGPLIIAPQRPYAPYSPLQLPGPIDEQKMQSYRNSLTDRLRQLERQGVSPADPRRREIQQQLNELPGNGGR